MRILLFLLPTLLFSGDNTNTDIIPRTINFFIFFALLVYLAFPHLKNLYKGRISSISERLDAAQNSVMEVKAKKEDAAHRLKKAKEQAESMVVNAREQDSVISKTMEEELQKELLALQQAYEYQKEYMQKRAKIEVVDRVIEKVFDGDDTKLSQNDLLQIIARKVA